MEWPIFISEEKWTKFANGRTIKRERKKDITAQIKLALFSPPPHNVDLYIFSFHAQFMYTWNMSECVTQSFLNCNDSYSEAIIYLCCYYSI